MATIRGEYGIRHADLRAQLHLRFTSIRCRCVRSSTSKVVCGHAGIADAVPWLAASTHVWKPSRYPGVRTPIQAHPARSAPPHRPWGSYAYNTKAGVGYVPSHISIQLHGRAIRLCTYICTCNYIIFALVWRLWMHQAQMPSSRPRALPAASCQVTAAGGFLTHLTSVSALPLLSRPRESART